jgi:hypothetical protein
MSQQKVKIFIAIDEHGNYNVVGSSTITDDNEHTAIAIVEERIRVEGVQSKVMSFSVMVDLPEQTEEQKASTVDESKDDE